MANHHHNNGDATHDVQEVNALGIHDKQIPHAMRDHSDIGVSTPNEVGLFAHFFFQDLLEIIEVHRFRHVGSATELLAEFLCIEVIDCC